jgi:hypothetical protein
VPDRRDERRPPVPPPHVRAQTAGEVSFDDPPTHPGIPLDEVIARRTKEISKAVTALSTRTEVLEAGHRTIGKRLDAQDVQLVKVAGDTDYMRGKVDVLVGQITQRELVTHAAQVGIQATAAQAAIVDNLDARKARRERMTRLIAAIVGLLVSGGFVHWLVSKL